MQSSSPLGLLGILLVIAGFPIAFGSLWSLVSLILAAASGWRGMTAAYRCPEALQGTPLPSGHAVRVGLTRYRGTLTFEAAAQGLIARVAWPFPFHPALLFPWEAIGLQRATGGFYAGELQVAQGSTFHREEEAFTAIERARQR